LNEGQRLVGKDAISEKLRRLSGSFTEEGGARGKGVSDRTGREALRKTALFIRGNWKKSKTAP